MKWFLSRISENSSKLAIGTIVTAAGGAASHQIDWVTALAAIVPAILHIFVPNNAATPPAAS